jgi:hypothetical protein
MNGQSSRKALTIVWDPVTRFWLNDWSANSGSLVLYPQLSEPRFVRAVVVLRSSLMFSWRREYRGMGLVGAANQPHPPRSLDLR